MKYEVMCKYRIDMYRRRGPTYYIYIAGQSKFKWLARHIMRQLQKNYPENEYWIEENK